MNVKPGYKHTEVGIIPEDWEVKPMCDLFSFSGGVAASRDQLGPEGHLYLHYGDIHTSPASFVDVQKSYDDIPKLKVSLADVPKKSLLNDGDVVFVDASEDEEGASRHHLVVNPRGIPFISGLHTIVAKPKCDSLNTAYKQHCFQSRAIKSQFRFYAVGTKVSGVSKTNIAKILLPIPPKVEQEAIAGALSDADALIESLEQLVAKKRQIKHGTMQQLLTGQKRLPGFLDKWESRHLGELGKCIRGVSYNPTSDLYPFDTHSSVRLLRSNNVQEATVVLSDIQFVDSSRVAIDQYLEQNDVLICMANGSRELVGKAGRFMDDDGYRYTFGAFMGAFRPNCDRSDKSFAFYLFHTDAYRRHINVLLAGSSINNLTPASIESLAIEVPPTIIEQAAIAEVLVDMDTEIAAIETKLAKARQIKQGMMQELLTGRTRLI